MNVKKRSNEELFCITPVWRSAAGLSMMKCGLLGLSLLTGSVAIASTHQAATVVYAQGEVDPKLNKELDEIASKYLPEHQPGASILVMKNGKVLLRKGYGLANLEAKQKNQAEYVFRLGSITKQFTAVAIMQLVEQGKLNVHDPLTKYFPGFSEAGNKVTIEHLLTHTSGIPSYTSKPGFVALMSQDKTVEGMLAGMQTDRLEFEPGTAWKYNNSGYYILGALIEKVSGESYAEYLQKHIFQPLNMQASAYEGVVKSQHIAVTGYTNQSQIFVPSPKISMTIPYAAGALVSNVDDMARWDNAIAAGKLLKPESWKQVFTDYRLSSGQSSNYGYGWQIGSLEGKPMRAHSGGINGFQTHALSLPSERIYAVVLANSDSGIANPEVLASRLAAAAMGKAIPEFKAVKLDAKVLDQYVGVYKIDEKNRRFVSREGDQLVMTRSNGPRTVFQAYSENGFFQSQDSLLRVEFQKDAQGKVDRLVVYQRGNMTVHPRLIEDLPLADKPYPMTLVEFDRLVGEYELMPGFVLTIWRDGDRFLSKATGQGDVVLVPTASDSLKSTTLNARITFVKGVNGEISHLVLNQNGKSYEAKKISQ